MNEVQVTKIDNVDITVCSKEQVVAYAFCIVNEKEIKANYNKYDFAFQKADVIHHYINKAIEEYRNDDRFDIDAIFISLNQGMEDYIKNSKSLALSNYKEIGEVFKIPYKVIEK